MLAVGVERQHGVKTPRDEKTEPGLEGLSLAAVVQVPDDGGAGPGGHLAGAVIGAVVDYQDVSHVPFRARDDRTDRLPGVIGGDKGGYRLKLFRCPGPLCGKILLHSSTSGDATKMEE